MLVAAAGLVAPQIAVIAMSWSHAAANAWYARPFAAATVVVSAVFVGTGLLVVRRRSDNAVGWLLTVIGTTSLLYQAASEYAMYGVLVAPGALPIVGIAAVLSQTLWIIPFATVPILLLRYPDGQLPTLRWRWGETAAIGAVALLVGPGTAVLWRYHDRPDVLLFADETIIDPLGETILWTAVALVLAAGFAAAASLVVRWRRSRDVERLQLKWLVLAGVIMSLQGVSLFVPGLGAWTEVLLLAGMASVPVAVAVAVTRYRLYEIDRFLSRTVSYGVLTLLLLGIYLVAVLGLGVVVRGLTGGAGGDLVVGLSTLIVAALFLPLRRRVQTAVDRRFNRARYDALRTVESFSSRLRDELDLLALEGELQQVVTATLQPAWTAVWITEHVGADT